MAQVYNQMLDFQAVLNGLKEEKKKQNGDDPLKDLSNVSVETIQFFQDLLNATNTSQLRHYSDAILNDSMDLLYDSKTLLEYIQNYVEDTSILGDRDHMRKQIKARHLKSSRRLL